MGIDILKARAHRLPAGMALAWRGTSPRIFVNTITLSSTLASVEH